MPIPLTADQVLDRYFPDMRCKVLDVAAAMDRLERAAGGSDIRGDQRMVNLRRAVEVLLDGRADRAERIQMIFSDDYEPDWQRS